jgi:hypothetical protein
LKKAAFFLVIILTVIKAGASDFELVQEFKNVKGMIAVDKLGNIFTIEDGTLKKYDPGMNVRAYSNRRFGSVSHVDVADPLNIVVFFRDFGTVVILDQNLAEKKIFLSNQLHEFDTPHLVSSSVKGGFWGFFPVVSNLVLFNDRGMVEIRSEEINRKHPDLSTPVYMVEMDDKLYLSANGIWVFDQFGNYIYRIQQISPPFFQVQNNKIFFVNNAQLLVYDIALNTQRTIDFPEVIILSFFLLDDIVFLQTDVSLKKFRYKGVF